MSSFTVKTSAALRDAIAGGTPMALYAMPGTAALEIIDVDDLEITRFDRNDSSPFVIQETGTGVNDYMDRVTSIISDLKRDGGKVVISRLAVASSRRDIVDVIDDYFSMFHDMFRYVYTTPETGVWFGATPELLAAVDDSKLTISTMALAGTRPSDATGDWDSKNLEEHDMVTRFITSTLAERCHDIDVGPYRDLRFGSIVHLCNDITGSLNADTDIDAVVNSLHPTPAVAGYPREKALKAIRETERHNRLFYAGTISPRLPGHERRIFVNLRCAMARPADDGLFYYNIFSGGGITADSKPGAEWDEAVAKAKPIIDCINR